MELKSHQREMMDAAEVFFRLLSEQRNRCESSAIQLRNVMSKVIADESKLHEGLTDDEARDIQAVLDPFVQESSIFIGILAHMINLHEDFKEQHKMLTDLRKKMAENFDHEGGGECRH